MHVPAAHARGAFRLGLVLCAVLCSADAALAANCIWAGLGTNNRWSTPANWDNCEGRAPKNGDDLRFPLMAARPTSENDIPGLEVRTIVLDQRRPEDGPYDISGVAIAVTTSIRVLAPVTVAGGVVFVRLPVVMSGLNPEITIGDVGRLSINGSLSASDKTLITIGGRGTVLLFNAANQWEALRVIDATMHLGAAGVLPDDASLSLDRNATLIMEAFEETIGTLSGREMGGNPGPRIMVGRRLTIRQKTDGVFQGTISGSQGITKNGPAMLTLARPLTGTGRNTYTDTTTVNEGVLTLFKDNNTRCIPGPLVIKGGVVRLMGDRQFSEGVNAASSITVDAPGVLDLNGFRDAIGSLGGTGTVRLGAGALTIGVSGARSVFSGVLTAEPLTPGQEVLTKVGTSTVTLTGESTLRGIVAVREGGLVVEGRLNSSQVLVAGGVVGTLHADELLDRRRRRRSVAPRPDAGDRLFAARSHDVLPAVADDAALGLARHIQPAARRHVHDHQSGGDQTGGRDVR